MNMEKYLTHINKALADYHIYKAPVLVVSDGTSPKPLYRGEPDYKSIVERIAAIVDLANDDLKDKNNG